MVFGVRGFDTGMPVRSAGTLTPFMDDQRRRVSSTALASKQCPGALYRGLAVRIFWMGAAALPSSHGDPATLMKQATFDRPILSRDHPDHLAQLWPQCVRECRAAQLVRMLAYRSESTGLAFAGTGT